MGRGGLAVGDSWELGVDEDGRRPIVRSEPKNFEVSGIAGFGQGMSPCQKWVNLQPEPVKASEAGQDEMQMLADLIIRVPVRASPFQLLDEA
jgi:hypothetical protein